MAERLAIALKKSADGELAGAGAEVVAVRVEGDAEAAAAVAAATAAAERRPRPEGTGILRCRSAGKLPCAQHRAEKLT